MFGSIEVPFDSVMLFNVIKLKEGVTIDDVEMALGEMCNVVKNTYGDDTGGFIAGQVFKNAGFISKEGSMTGRTTGESDNSTVDSGDIAIVTYWRSFDQHEKSHADVVFKEKFSELATFCDQSWELGYELLWQGVPE